MSVAAPGRSWRGRAKRGLGLGRWVIAALAALFALSIAVLCGLLVRVWIRGGVVTGGDGFLAADPLQRLTWLRVHQLGLGVVASYAAWKPVAVVALFAGALALSRRCLPRSGDRGLALALRLVRPFTDPPRRFGCAAVYPVR